MPFIAFVFERRKTRRSIMTRLVGVILAALAVQFVADGIRELMAV